MSYFGSSIPTNIGGIIPVDDIRDVCVSEPNYQLICYILIGFIQGKDMLDEVKGLPMMRSVLDPNIYKGRDEQGFCDGS